jgi:hypothetical protein
MLPNEEFALACLAYYEEQGFIVDAKNGQFAHCPLPRNMGESGYYLLWEHHQHQGLLQSKDLGRKCFYNYETKKWLLTSDYFPDNFFELWDIYDEYSGGVHHSQYGKRGEKSHNYGKPRSEECKQKQREKMLGRRLNPQTIEKMKRKRLGKKCWVDKSGKCVRQVQSPGPEWKNGMKWKG